MSDDVSQNSTPADDDLVRRAKIDGDALALLFDQYYSRVMAYCLRRLSERAAAEDVTSEVFLRVAEHLPRFSGRGASDFRRWLFRIATNAVHAHLRQSLRRRDLLDAAARQGRLHQSGEEPSPADTLDWPQVRAAIDSLDDREQTIVSLRFFAGLSHDEIASVVQATPGAVRTALSRVLKSLREKLRAADHLER